MAETQKHAHSTRSRPPLLADVAEVLSKSVCVILALIILPIAAEYALSFLNVCRLWMETVLGFELFALIFLGPFLVVAIGAMMIVPLGVLACRLWRRDQESPLSNWISISLFLYILATAAAGVLTYVGLHGLFGGVPG